jgi:4-diphosphocytidyl-2-C-methyl-D-erythritol kinase
MERANAKINLYLDVVGKRENGYHNIISIMQTVSVCDLVGVDYRPGLHTRISLTASGNSAMPTDCRNLAWRAAEQYLMAIRESGEVHVTIEKHIPMAAGLAGGSADAAAVLRGLNHLCGNPFSVQRLCEIGEPLGADVPFCVLGGTALVTGIGETLEPIVPMPQCHMVVACMGDGVSTPWAYGKLDEKYDSFSGKPKKTVGIKEIEKLLKAKKVSEASEFFYNVFEEVVPMEKPWVDRLKNCMIQNDAICAMMSGSGPSVFGMFETAEAAGDAYSALREMGVTAFVCHPTQAYTRDEK